MLMTNVANIFKPPKAKEFSFKDFELKWDPPKPQTVDDFMRIMSAMMHAQNRRPN